MDISRGTVLVLAASSLLAARPAGAAKSALETLKEMAGDEAVSASITPVPVVFQDPRPVPSGSTTFPVAVTLSRTILDPAPGDDADRDGLADAVEGELADAFRPYIVLDSRENARRPGEPLVVFQARPEGCVGPRARCGGKPLKVHIIYNTLWRQDGGYVASTFCGDSHKGDVQVVGAVAESSDDGRTFRLTSIENWNYVWPKNSGRVLFLAGTHPWVYLSGGKHHQFFDTFANDKPSPYSKWACTEAMDGKGRAFLSELKGPRTGSGEDWNNAGEPESHPADRFVGDLGYYGYPGESAWDTRPFCGGQDCDRTSNPTSRNAEVWLKTPFFVPER